MNKKLKFLMWVVIYVISFGSIILANPKHAKEAVVTPNIEEFRQVHIKELIVTPVPVKKAETNKVTSKKKKIKAEKVTLTDTFEKDVIEEEDSIELFAVQRKGYEVFGRNNIDFISEEEFDFLVGIVSAEARGESDEGIRAVVDVILNRIDSNGFPNTLNEVLTQRNQFETYTKGYYKTAPHTEKVIDAVLYALQYKTIPEEVLFFRMDHYHPYGTPWKQIGCHYFS